MFTPDYFKNLSMTMQGLSQYLLKNSGQPLFSGGGPRVEVVLNDGARYAVRYFMEEPGAGFAEGVLTFLAYGSADIPFVMVSVPYAAIARVSAFEPPKETQEQRIVGFQVEAKKP